MNTFDVAPGIRGLSFGPHQARHHFATNVYVIGDGGSAILIDTGYRSDAPAIKSHLQERGLTPETVILSHFHDDHMGSLPELGDCTVIGHRNYRATLDKWTPASEHRFYVPDLTVAGERILSTANRELRIIALDGGHSESDLLTLVDGKYLHIGDLILQDPQGRPILPFAEPGLVGGQIAALERLGGMIGYTFLLSHGPVIRDTAVKLREIEDRIVYLRTLEEAVGPISYSRAVRDCRLEFLHSEWHDSFFEQ